MSKEEQKGNMAPGQEHAPETGKTRYNANELPGEKIAEGANDESQLDKFKANLPDEVERPDRATPEG